MNIDEILKVAKDFGGDDNAWERDYHVGMVIDELCAEVLRLRERDAAWEWLMLNGRRNDYIFEREPRDPVALAKALGWKGVGDE